VDSHPLPLRSGTRLGPYEILERIGAGGMGEVYRARHVKLDRPVAVKVLPTGLSADRARVARLEREARLASALNHPNIVTIYDVGDHAGTTYIAMELVEGRTLADVIAEERPPVDEALRLAIQVADALAKAHEAGIVHRDVKPANVMVTPDGYPKVLDFGIARSVGTAPMTVGGGPSAPGMTLEAGFVGTPHYMAPEQIEGKPVDHRADQFAFGAMVHEMLAGELPFRGPNLTAVVSMILAQDPPPLRQVRSDTPADLERIVLRCLAKEPGGRYASTAELVEALRACEERRVRARYGLGATLRRPAVAGPIAVALLGAAVGGGWWVRDSGRRWAEREAVDEITRHIERGDVWEAYRVARVAERYRPGDPVLERLMDRMVLPLPVSTNPSGAEVRVKGYGTPDAPWEYLGVTPFEMRYPYTLLRWRITLDGHEPFEGAPLSARGLALLAQGMPLDPAGAVPPGTVRIPAGPSGAPAILHRDEERPLVPSFFLGRYEVTNREYRDFVSAGGYANPGWWPAPMVRDGREIPWAEALEWFRDAGGSPGPATWMWGAYPDGEDDHPVGGLSWFEAAAYCAFAGRALPTVFHWFSAIGQDQLSDILQHSNLDGIGTAPVGRFPGLAGYGTYDMAGNVKEWAWNATGDQRYVLGAAWNEPAYLFRHPIAQDPWDRSAVNGVRCAAYPEPPPDELLAPVMPLREYGRPEPISDEAFELLRSLYTYDPRPLEARVERVDDGSPGYRREIVSIRTAYGSDRMEIHLLFPRDAQPPYQSVIWFPGDDVFLFRSSQTFASAYLFDFIPEAGRVLVHPIYSGMYERWAPIDISPSGRRDRLITWSQDIARAIDYLEDRPDFDAGRIAFYGFSGGAAFAPIFTAVEPRLVTAILLGGGLSPIRSRPEADPVHFATRSATPTLMINGVDDFLMPYELSQRPLFDLLGAPDDRKRLARLTGGHIPAHRLDIVREVLDWLDRYLGPVPGTGRI
jgi:eukaryotic-like serine/threonine-protein kinase